MSNLRLILATMLLLSTYLVVSKVDAAEVEHAGTIPKPVLEFMGSSASATQDNPKAPPETAQFGQLAGIFYQGPDEFLYWDYFKRDAILTQLRVFNPTLGVWSIAFIKNGGDEFSGNIFGSFSAQLQGDELIMDYVLSDAVRRTRIVFYEITDDSFPWRSETTEDSGESWTISSS